MDSYIADNYGGRTGNGTGNNNSLGSFGNQNGPMSGGGFDELYDNDD